MCEGEQTRLWYCASGTGVSEGCDVSACSINGGGLVAVMSNGADAAVWWTRLRSPGPPTMLPPALPIVDELEMAEIGLKRWSTRRELQSRAAKSVGDGVRHERGLQRGGDYFRLAATFGKCVVTSRFSAAMASSHRDTRLAKISWPAPRDQLYFGHYSSAFSSLYF
ncbi:unnamed protein product [Pieris brassicae]|uniref:Uncharacterized protein n=1 Tax=Pieris brassicae TaxID=7116 RepID=A0A9P0T5R4_PIEBR|nr:unnamed protein product [Pieris brassicae]